MNDLPDQSGWGQKFANAFRGIVVGVRGQNSFMIHVPIAILVCALAYWLRLEHDKFCLLLLCIGIVLAGELFNSAIERLAKSITHDFDDNIRDALDIASGAVLTLSVTSALIGAAIFMFAFFG